MDCFLRSIVSLLLLAVVVVGGLVPPYPEGSPGGVFLGTILNDHSRGSTGGVCFFGAPTARLRAVQDFLLTRIAPGGRRGFLWEGLVLVRLCQLPGLCSTRVWKRAVQSWRCELVVVMLAQRSVFKQLQELSHVPCWTPSAAHVFLSDGSWARERDDRLSDALLSWGVIRPLFVEVKTDSTLDVRFPILFARRSIRVSPTEASRRWLQRFDQLADLHGFQYRTLYHTLIPHLYRYEGVFGGPDYRFLQIVLERQNATHQWIYHRSTDAQLNSTDLQYVDRRFLERGHVSFSLNRLMGDRADTLEKLYLNTFDGTCVLVPRRKLQTFILRLWQPFSQELWYAVLAIALLTVAGNLTLPRLFAVNYLLVLLFGLAVLEYRLAALDRTILLVLDVLLFLLREAYTAKIITYMIELQFEPELQTMADLGRVGPPLLLAPGDYEALAGTLTIIEPRPRVVLREDFSSFHTTWQEYFRGGFAHTVPCSYGQALVASDEMNAPGAPQFYLLRERLALHPEAFTFPRRSPFREKMRFFAASLLEAGIYGSWLKGDHYARDHTPTLDEILHFENLASLFYVLLVGYAVSVGVFLAERMGAIVGRKPARRWATRVRNRAAALGKEKSNIIITKAVSSTEK
uniref:Ionotropic glutamate receptor L-glutamate and glycine-binding domain-containing protein n=1 Tax=Anopheles atroparvus TaxID=41427 RepID=A0A182IPB5_ANOAO